MNEVEILEVYLPARVEYLAKLYVELREQLFTHPKPLLEGFSIYEVNGAFRGESEVFQERTAIIRIVLNAPVATDDGEKRTHEARVGDIANMFITITGRQEEELWLTRVRAERIVMRS